MTARGAPPTAGPTRSASTRSTPSGKNAGPSDVTSTRREPSAAGSRARARPASARAVASAPDEAEARLALAGYYENFAGDEAKAAAEYETALRLQPGNAEVLATMLDGRVTLDSTVGKGSKFTLVLPRKPRRR